jgi:hypothetical protein
MLVLIRGSSANISKFNEILPLLVLICFSNLSLCIFTFTVFKYLRFESWFRSSGNSALFQIKGINLWIPEYDVCYAWISPARVWSNLVICTFSAFQKQQQQ